MTKIIHRALVGPDSSKREMMSWDKRQNWVPDNSYDIDRCIEIYEKFPVFIDVRPFVKYYEEWLVGSCFAYGQSYDRSMFIELPGRIYVNKNGDVVCIYNKIYDYGNAFMSQGRIGTKPPPKRVTIDELIADL